MAPNPTKEQPATSSPPESPTPTITLPFVSATGTTSKRSSLIAHELYRDRVADIALLLPKRSPNNDKERDHS
ncbi:hypothetical protein H4Q26_015239 [Puccinia striiformis f. sp. tritici PST-130]|nr:hypothetical protein H4Q26_015239 [Puccinia striiformis f. sp. tritici PST-130]